MSGDATKVRKALNGDIYLKPLWKGTAAVLPTNTITAIDAGFIKVGFISPDGFSTERTTENADYTPWNSGGLPIRRDVNDQGQTLTFSADEQNDLVLQIMENGYVPTQAVSSSAERSFAPEAGYTGLFAVVIPWFDGTFKVRQCWKQMQASPGGAVKKSRSDVITNPITLSEVALPDNSQNYFRYDNWGTVTP